MRRRARRKKGAGKNPWLGKLVFALGGLLLLAVGASYIGLRSYLQSDGFRQLLSTQVSKAVNMDGNFAPFFWDGLAVETEGFEATGEGIIQSARANRVGTEIGFGGLTRGVWEIQATRIKRIHVTLDTTIERPPIVVQPIAPKVQSPSKKSSWMPSEVELESLDIGDLNVDVTTAKGQFRASGIEVNVLPDSGKGAYKAELFGGRISLPYEKLPELRVKRIEGTYRDGSVFITRAEVSALESARIIAFGESNFSNGFHSFEGNVDGVRCSELLNETWAQRLMGDVATSFQIDNRTGSNLVSGELEILNGTLTALPMLETLSAYADTRRFRVLQLNEAHTKWLYQNGEYWFNDLVISSEGLVRLEGKMSVRGENINGEFQLGIVPGILAKIPGAETHVFRPGAMGLLWTPIRVSGTLSKPKEDLTKRLMAAAGMRMFELLPGGSEQVLKYSSNLLGESPEDFIEKIEEGEKIFKEAKGLLQGILGN